MQHFTGNGHCECPQRVEVIENALVKAKLMDEFNTLEPRQATKKEVSLCHSEEYIEYLNKQIERIPPYKDLSVSFFPNPNFKYIVGDFQISKDTYNTSLYAAGAPLTAIDYILDRRNDTKQAFCIVRPPGHHAHKDTGSGFCVLNNVAIAAKYLSNLNFKVVIIDWDAHHGDGTQELVEDDKNIFYFSTHRDTAMDPATGSSFYPGPHWGHADQTGMHHNVMNCPVSGNNEKCRKEILSSFEKLEKSMDTFQPDFVLISCGFDAHENDTLVGLGLKDEDYVTMTKCAIRIAEKYADGRIVSVLEGGYNLEAISGAAKVHVETLQSTLK